MGGDSEQGQAKFLSCIRDTVEHLQIAAKAKGGFVSPALAGTPALDPTVSVAEPSRARSARSGKRSAAHGKKEEHSGKKKGRKLSR